MIKYLKNNDFKNQIQERILVDFYAPWCGPCKMLGEELESIENNIDIPILKVNVDEYDDIAREYGVMNIPTIILFENGEELKRNVGFISEEKIKEFIK